MSVPSFATWNFYLAALLLHIASLDAWVSTGAIGEPAGRQPFRDVSMKYRCLDAGVMVVLGTAPGFSSARGDTLCQEGLISYLYVEILVDVRASTTGPPTVDWPSRPKVAMTRVSPGSARRGRGQAEAGMLAHRNSPDQHRGRHAGRPPPGSRPAAGRRTVVESILARNRSALSQHSSVVA